MNYTRKSPCNDCPYRMDAPTQLWAREEFQDLLDKDKSYFGAAYGCHKKDNHVCVGFLMNQDKRNFPSIALRISLSTNKVNREYLDNLSCKSEMFESVEDMIDANFPEILEEY